MDASIRSDNNLGEPMFIDNKYTKWYYQILSTPDASASYTGVHHKIPRSLGGNNEQENLVRLSARQHFVCHLLLTKMVNGDGKRKMVYALQQMQRSNKHHARYIPSSRIFELVRRMLAIVTSEIMKRRWADPEKSSALIKSMNTVEAKAKNSKAQKIAQNQPEVKNKLIVYRTGLKASETTIEKMKISAKKICGDTIRKDGAKMYCRWHHDLSIPQRIDKTSWSRKKWVVQPAI
jgi:hypothetical protein